MNKHMHQPDIEHILAGLQSAATGHTTDEQDGPRRLIDVHIYDLPAADEERAAEETDSQTIIDACAERSDHLAAEETSSTASGKRRPLPRVPVLIAVGVLLVAGITILSSAVLPLLTPSATITLVPRAVPIRTSATLTVGETGAQVRGRTLVPLTLSESRSMPTSGQGHQDARAASGMITFYNAALVLQVIPAGTVLPTAAGSQVVTEQDARIPAGSLATNGAVTVAAHALRTGPGGNLTAGAIYGPCCRANVFAASGTFAGGQQARDYPMVRRVDIEQAGQQITTSLQMSAQGALQSQVHSDETLLTPLTCTSTLTADHAAGDEASMVGVRVDETCSGSTYQQQALHDAAARLLTQTAQRVVGSHYRLQGSIQTTITQTRGTVHNAMVVEVSASGTWVYQFTEAELADLKALVAGACEEQARLLLAQRPGVQTVAITISHSSQLPGDASQIVIAWEQEGAVSTAQRLQATDTRTLVKEERGCPGMSRA